MVVFCVLGNSSLGIEPMVIGGYVDRLALTERQAGFVASMELCGFSLGMLALIGLDKHISRRNLAIGGIVILVFGNLSSCLVENLSSLLSLRCITGVGYAMSLAVFLKMAAADEQPENTFATANSINIAYVGVVTPLVPGVLAAWGLPGVFAGLAAIAAITTPFIPWISERGRPPPRPKASVLADSRSPWRVPQVAMLLAMMLLLYTGHGAMWGFQERIGVQAGMTSRAAGTWIGASMLVGGVGGSLLARTIGLRLGRILPQFLSLSISAAAALLLVYGGSAIAFAVGCGLVALSWFYGLPFQLGLLSAFDPQGRANMAGIVMTTAGAAMGPALAGLLIGRAGHVAVGIFAASCYVLSLILVLPAAIGISRPGRVQAA
jgi:predicted MFS family arabinose efflux permease